jgi:hypothetical protein
VAGVHVACYFGRPEEDLLGVCDRRLRLTAVDRDVAEISCGVAPRESGMVERSCGPVMRSARWFDRVGLADVLEHGDDVGLLRQLRPDFLARGGPARVTVPARCRRS